MLAVDRIPQWWLRPDRRERSRVGRAHRVAWVLANGPIPAGLHVCHACDNPGCVRPGHLFLGTAADNAADMWKKGRGRPGSLPGEAHPRARLQNKDVLAIREADANGEPRRAIARRFGMSPGNVRNIVNRKAWTHI